MHLSVVLVAGSSPLRLRWSLSALLEQRPCDDWECIVVCGKGQCAASHGGLDLPRYARLIETDGDAPARANAGWKAARGHSVAFLPSEQRPAPCWLDCVRATGSETPRAVVHGVIRPDPDQLEILAHTPQQRAVWVDYPTLWDPIPSMVCQRETLEVLGGFDESLDASSQIDFLSRARSAGWQTVVNRDLLTFAGIDGRLLPARLRDSWLWRRPVALLRRQPSLRRELRLGLFSSSLRAQLAFIAGAGLLGRRPRLGLAAALGALVVSSAERPRETGRPAPRGAKARTRSMVRAGARAPATAALEAVDFAAVLRDSLAARTPVL